MDIGEPESRRTAFKEGDSAPVWELRRWDIAEGGGDGGRRTDREEASNGGGKRMSGGGQYQR